MNISRLLITALQRIGTLVALTGLAACSSSDDGPQCSPFVAVLTMGLGCLGTVTVTSPPIPPPPPPASPPPPPPPASPPGSNIVVISRHAEYEPNNTLDNANPVQFRSAAADEHIGLEITGTVTRTADASDFFVFTPPRSGAFLVYLCADTCGEPLQSDAVYLMVYDQSQSTIASTSMGGMQVQQLSVELVAGLAYYVEVNGYNTGASTLDYKLVVID